jgi:hypothetical protein
MVATLNEDATTTAQHQSFTVLRAAVAFGSLAANIGAARAEDKPLVEAVNFAGTFIYLGAKPPAFVIGAIRNGETAVIELITELAPPR